MESNETTTNTHKNDNCCWVCHKVTFDPKFNCPTCFRSFHSFCLDLIPVLEIIDEENSEKCCSVCIAMKKSENGENPNQLNMLNHLMKAILCEPKFKLLKNATAWQKPCNKIIYKIDLSKINANVKFQRYDSFYAFLIDIECIHHNCFVCTGISSITRVAYDLLEFCTSETQAISSCVSCYDNKCSNFNVWNTLACDKPHLILWVKFKSVPEIHPAKFISVNANRKDIKVISFINDKFVDVSVENCQLYTTELSTNEVQQEDELNYAIKKLNDYAKNVEIKFNCRFVNTLPHAPLDLDHIDEHTKVMFPGYINYLAAPNNKRCGSNDSSEEVPTKKRQTQQNDDSDALETFKKMLSLGNSLHT